MIFDGLWKRELQKLSFDISIWKSPIFFCEVGKHMLSRAVLYSATVLRKAIEDESEAETIAKKYNCKLKGLRVKNCTVIAIKYPYITEEGWTVRGFLAPENYGKGSEVQLNIKDVCNWLLHSYVWSIASDSEQKRYAGFLVASDFDKEKFVHFISFEQWQKVLRFAIEKGVF